MILILCGIILIFIAIIIKNTKIRVSSGITGCLSTIAGVTSVLSDSNMITLNVKTCVSCHVIGLAILLNVIMKIWLYRCVDTKISARLLDIDKRMTTRNGTFYTPVYEYTYDGVPYINQNAISYRHHKTKKLMIDEIYDVWIDSDEPNVVLDDRHLSGFMVFLLICGILVQVLPYALILKG